MAKKFSISSIFTAVDMMTGPVKRMQASVERMQSSVKTSMGVTEQMAASVGKASKRMTDTAVVNVNSAMSAITRVRSRVTETLTSIDRGIDRSMRGAKRLALAGAVGVAITGTVVADVVRTGAEFEQQLVNAAVKFPGIVRQGTDEFKRLQEAALVTGKTTTFTATQSAEALKSLAAAGFTVEGAIGALPTVIDLATAAEVDLQQATLLAVETMGAFGLISEDAATNNRNLARVADILAVTSNRATMSILEMAESIRDGAAVGIAAGQSIETISAMIAGMSQASVKGTIGGTGLKNIMLALSAPTSEAAKVFRRLKIPLADANQEVRDSIDVMADLKVAIMKLPEAKRTTVVDAIFGRIPVAAAFAIMDRATGYITDVRNELQHLEGGIKEMADIQRDTVSGSLKAFTSSIEHLKLTIYSMNNGPLKDVIDRTTDWIRANSDLIALKVNEWVQWLVENWEDLIKTLNRVTIAAASISALIIAVKLLTAAMTLLNIVMALNPIVLIIGAIVVATAAVAAFAADVGGLRSQFEEMPSWVKWILTVTNPLIMIGRSAGFVIDNWQYVKDFFVTLFTKTLPFYFGMISEIASPLWKFIDNMATMIDPLVKPLDTLIDWLAGKLDMLLAKIMPVADAIDLISKSGQWIDKAFSGMSLNTAEDLAVAGSVGASPMFAQHQARIAAGPAAPMVTPQERVSREIQETRQTTEVIVTANPGTTAKIPDTYRRNGVRVRSTGGF